VRLGLPLLRAVFDNELRDAVRDRRALVSALLFPLFGPVMLGLMFTGVQQNFGGDDDVLKLPVAGAEHAPGLVAFLRENGVDVVDAPADPEKSVRSGDHDVILVIDKGYAKDFARGVGADVKLYLDRSRTTAAGRTRKVRGLISAHGSRIASFRLLARGVAPGIMQPIAVAEVDLATPRSHSANLLHVVGLFVILAVFVGSMQVAIDAMAGERERGSLEALLLNPVAPMTLVVGKWLVALIFGAASALLTLVLTGLILPAVPLETIGLSLQLGAVEGALIALLVLPLAPLAAAAQLLVSAFARSFKEAQTYLSLLLFVPMVPGLIAQVLGLRTAMWMLPIPALSQQTLIGDLLRGDPVTPLAIIVSAASSLLLSWLCLRITARLLTREGIIFAGQ